MPRKLEVKPRRCWTVEAWEALERHLQERRELDKLFQRFKHSDMCEWRDEEYCTLYGEPCEPEYCDEI